MNNQYVVWTMNGKEFEINELADYADTVGIHSRLKERIYKKLAKKYKNHERWVFAQIMDSLKVVEKNAR